MKKNELTQEDIEKTYDLLREKSGRTQEQEFFEAVQTYYGERTAPKRKTSERVGAAVGKGIAMAIFAAMLIVGFVIVPVIIGTIGGC